jgi:hypothetical protein
MAWWHVRLALIIPLAKHHCSQLTNHCAPMSSCHDSSMALRNSLRPAAWPWDSLGKTVKVSCERACEDIFGSTVAPYALDNWVETLANNCDTNQSYWWREQKRELELLVWERQAQVSFGKPLLPASKDLHTPVHSPSVCASTSTSTNLDIMYI